MKFRAPNTALPAAPTAGRVRAYDKEIQAAIEKQRSHYIELSCGHLTTWEQDELWSWNRPARNKYWCEKHGKWVKIKPRKKPKPLPQTPLF